MPSNDVVVSAVADHLRDPARSAVARARPEFDSYTARLATDVTRVVVGYFGVQERDPSMPDGSRDARALIATMGERPGPAHHDVSRYVDEAGYPTLLVVGYWLDPSDFATWFAEHGAEWASGEHRAGRFAEVVRPTVRRLETLFSSDRDLQGLGALAERVSEPVWEHGYWGGMRDRMPDAATGLRSTGAPVVRPAAGRVVVEPHEGLCLIRSGQDFSGTDGAERAFYLGEVEPQLRAGMDFLRDEGLAIGCFANRYVSVLGDGGAPAEKSYAVSWWRDLTDLEVWARTHPTHVRIFEAFNAHMARFGADAALRLYHEVVVVPASDQLFEYANCHPLTGMLRVARR
jgi:aldoxime dehydratase